MKNVFERNGMFVGHFKLRKQYGRFQKTIRARYYNINDEDKVFLLSKWYSRALFYRNGKHGTAGVAKFQIKQAYKN